MKTKKKKKGNAYNGVKNIGILIFIWGIGIVVLLGAYAMTKRGPKTSYVVTESTNSHMNIYTIDTKGSAVLLESRGSFILMNVGSKDSKDKVIDFVSSKIARSKANGTYKTFSVYLSNFDESYIGEIKDVFKYLQIDNFYLPEEKVVAEITDRVEADKYTQKYREMMKLAEEEKAEVINLFTDYEVVFGDAKITILGLDDINSKDYKNVSDYIKDSSIISLVTIGKTKYLSSGSISSKIESRLIEKYKGNIQADIYALGDYGKDTSSSAEFLKYVHPDYSIATYNGKDESITKASKRTMYYGAFASTKKNGNIAINIENDNVSFKMDKNTIKLQVAYKADTKERLSGKVYTIAKENTLSEHWDFFVTDFEGYQKERIKYGIALANILSKNYGGEIFKGIESLDKNMTIDVIYSEVLVDSIRLNSEEVKIDVGDSVSLTATVDPINAKRSPYTWESDNKNVATVKDGVVSGISKGKATITVRMKNSAITAKCIVYVGDYDTSISGLSLGIKNIVIGKDTILPLNSFENENITWAVGNTNILSIDSNNVLRPIKQGVTVISGTLNGYTDSIYVKITDGFIVSNVSENTTVSTFVKDMKIENAKIISSQGNKKEDDEVVATYDLLVVEKEKDMSIYSISVSGDINGDGMIGKADVDLLQGYLEGKKKLSKVALRSSDANKDGKVNRSDVRVLNNYIKKNKGHDTVPFVE